MRRAPVKLFFLLVLALSAAGCDYWGFRKHLDEANQFSIMIPASWEAAEYLQSAILAKAPLDGPKDKFRENINVVVNRLPEKMSLETLTDYNKEELKRAMPKSKIVSEQGMYLGLTPGRVTVFDYVMDKMLLRTTTGVWLKGGRVYVVTCVAEAGKMKRYEGVFKKSMRSLRMF